MTYLMKQDNDTEYITYLHANIITQRITYAHVHRYHVDENHVVPYTSMNDGLTNIP